MCACDEKSGGLTIARLSNIYSAIFIDELQDFAGYDLVFLETLFRSSLHITAVGDPRQGTFSTNRSQKKKQFRKCGIIDWIRDGSANGLFTVHEKVECFRSNQTICDFADALFPDFPKTQSLNSNATGHDGIFFIKESEAVNYFNQFRPVVLRYKRTVNTLGLPASNIGVTKGRTFERVLIFPTDTMTNYLRTKDLSKAFDVAKLYVAVTRAKYSVAFVI